LFFCVLYFLFVFLDLFAFIFLGLGALASLARIGKIFVESMRNARVLRLFYFLMQRWKLFVSVGQIRLSFHASSPFPLPPFPGRRLCNGNGNGIGIHCNHCMSFVKVSSHFVCPTLSISFYLYPYPYFLPILLAALLAIDARLDFPIFLRFSGNLASLSRILIYEEKAQGENKGRRCYLNGFWHFALTYLV